MHKRTSPISMGMGFWLLTFQGSLQDSEPILLWLLQVCGSNYSLQIVHRAQWIWSLVSSSQGVHGIHRVTKVLSPPCCLGVLSYSPTLLFPHCKAGSLSDYMWQTTTNFISTRTSTSCRYTSRRSHRKWKISLVSEEGLVKMERQTHSGRCAKHQKETLTI